MAIAKMKIWGPVYDEADWEKVPSSGQVAMTVTSPDSLYPPMATFPPSQSPASPGDYAESLTEFLDWMSWESGFHHLEFRGLIKVQGIPETEAEARVGMMVSFDRLCRKLKEMNAPLAEHPEFLITGSGTGGFLRGEVTIRLYSDQYGSALYGVA